MASQTYSAFNRGEISHHTNVRQILNKSTALRLKSRDYTIYRRHHLSTPFHKKRIFSTTLKHLSVNRKHLKKSSFPEFERMGQSAVPLV